MRPTLAELTCVNALPQAAFYRAHSIRSLERSILGFVGFTPVHETLVGMVGLMHAAEAAKWMDKLRRLGRDAG